MLIQIKYSVKVIKNMIENFTKLETFKMAEE